MLPQRHSMGDLFTKALDMVGVPNTTFGFQGRVGDTGVSQGDIASWAGFGGSTGEAYVTLDRSLHNGPFEI